MTLTWPASPWPGDWLILHLLGRRGAAGEAGGWAWGGGVECQHWPLEQLRGQACDLSRMILTQSHTRAGCSAAAPALTLTTPSLWWATGQRTTGRSTGSSRTHGQSQTPQLSWLSIRYQGRWLGRGWLHPSEEGRGHVRHWQGHRHCGVSEGRHNE